MLSLGVGMQRRLVPERFEDFMACQGCKGDCVIKIRLDLLMGRN